MYYVHSGLRRLPMKDAPRITVDELKRRMEAGEDFTVIDVRNPREWAQSEAMLPEAVRIQVDDLDKNLARIPKNKPIVAYCT
jgi:rhodanese-related sulfurtransferase